MMVLKYHVQKLMHVAIMYMGAIVLLLEGSPPLLEFSILDHRHDFADS